MNWYFCRMPAVFRFLLAALLFSGQMFAQQADSSSQAPNKANPAKQQLRINLSADGSRYFQATFLNQTWLRYNQSNEGSTRFGKTSPETFDIGLRRTRIQLFGQVTERAFLYFQFGQNNYNNTAGYSATGGNRKLSAFFHDALTELKLSKGNQLKLGGGLTIMNGLSRFSQPSIGTIMSMDVPVFLQYSVDQIDQFDRRLAVYARGQLKKFDYRFYLSNPFPINSSGNAAPPISRNASFVNVSQNFSRNPGVNHQYGMYLAYNFFENENHTTPYMAGTYLGEKKVWNIALGGVYQKAATWYLSSNSGGLYTDTSFADMMHLGLESFLDMPLNKEKGTAVNAFLGFYSTNYGPSYLRYNGIMNPATGSVAGNLVQSTAYGNAFPMFGTGNILYAQAGYLLPKAWTTERFGRLMPYFSAQVAYFEALQYQHMSVLHIGLNWLLDSHRAKFSLDYQNRPTYTLGTNGAIGSGPRKGCITLQYQIFI